MNHFIVPGSSIIAIPENVEHLKFTTV